ncbi:TetR/AcrR family transcriptional regulator [Microbacterium hatanonis]|jgi:AcrR family transcriptional regulator|uniref:TetR/AcrR family transcriptional regulator n=1 Tax=Microbacterium hatanonis TaxID=404366 RepID=A0A5C8I1L5_9MICO|nr:TetR/AcrR family transcriptional regulator [Microbacterium hatanonis]TXK11960.1 TetR/AcrR family transcriptional regulator [Microbacterium hatanonis]
MTTDPPPIGRPGAYGKGVARRREILDKAIEVFAARGSQATSLRQIAQAIGVSHAALLHYFDSREQLLVAVYDHASRLSPPHAAFDERPGAVEELVEAASRNVGMPGMVLLYSTLVAASLEESSGVTTEYFSTRFERVRSDLTALLVRDQARGLIRQDVDAAEIAALLVAASDGLQIQWLLTPSMHLESTLRVFATLLKP